jgi:hypothetical protein
MSNISLNISGGNSVTPSAYSIKRISLTNHKGETYDIQNIVLKTEITESIYSNTLVCKLEVRDENNLIQDFPIIGQEIFEVVFATQSETYDEEETVLKFYVTEYPAYTRAKNARVQVYSFSGISEHAYLSRFKKISRSVKGLTSEIIETILKGDLKTDRLIVEDEPITVFQGIINIQSPLSAIEWLRKKTYDDKQAPYYFYETLKGNLRLDSHTELVSQEPYFDYINNSDFDYDPETEEDFLQRKHRIIELSSELNMGKIFQAVDGAFASENFYLNVGNKTFTSNVFKYKKSKDENEDVDFQLNSNSIGKKSSISNEFLIGDDRIDSLPQAHEEYISTNEYAFDGKAMNYNELKKNSMGVTRAYIENMETISHTLKLFGDFNLNAGVVIELKIPKAVDPELQRDLLQNTQDGAFDEHLSGNYLITSAIHTFEKGKYYTSVKVKRDSLTIDL